MATQNAVQQNQPQASK